MPKTGNAKSAAQPRSSSSHIDDQTDQSNCLVPSAIETLNSNPGEVRIDHACGNEYRLLLSPATSHSEYNGCEPSLSSHSELENHSLEMRFVDATSWESVLRDVGYVKIANK